MFQAMFNPNKDQYVTLPAASEENAAQEPQQIHTRTVNQAKKVVPSPVEGYPFEQDELYGSKCIRVGDKSILDSPLTSIVMSRGASAYGTKWAIAAAQTLATTVIKVAMPDGSIVEKCPNLVVGGTRSEDLVHINEFIEAGGRVAAFIPVGFIRYDWPPKVIEHVKNGKMVLISFFLPKAEWTIANAQKRNQHIATACLSLFIAECVARIRPNGTVDVDKCGTYNLAEQFCEQEKPILMPHWVVDGGRVEHLIIERELAGVILDPLPSTIDDQDQNPFRPCLPRKMPIKLPVANTEPDAEPDAQVA